MYKRTKIEAEVHPRFLCLEEFMNYTGLGRGSAMKLGKEIGCVMKVGRLGNGCLVCCHHGKIQTGKPKPGGYPLLRRDKKHPPDERKEGDTMVTYSDLIQFSIFIVALVSLCYEIFKGKRR